MELIAGAVLGAAFVALVAWLLRSRGASSTAAPGAQEAALAAAVEPVAQRLDALGELVRAIDRDRAKEQGSLHQQLTSLSGATAALQAETTTLSTALRDVRTRGTWGEVQLRRVVELAGMIEHCDFTEQATVAGDDGTLRPDLVVHLPERRAVVIDAKVPLGAYLKAVEATDQAVISTHLDAHAKAVAGHVRALAARGYDRHVEGSIDFVVLFVPGDVFLAAAFEQRPALFEDAARQGVLLASPTTLIALLRAVQLGWRQAQLAESAQVVAALGAELHERLGTFATHLGKVGTSLEAAVGRYNDAVGSLESRVLVSARKLGEHGVATGELPTVTPIDRRPRVPVASSPAQPPEVPVQVGTG